MFQQLWFSRRWAWITGLLLYSEEYWYVKRKDILNTLINQCTTHLSHAFQVLWHSDGAGKVYSIYHSAFVSSISYISKRNHSTFRIFLTFFLFTCFCHQPFIKKLSIFKMDSIRHSTKWQKGGSDLHCISYFSYNWFSCVYQWNLACSKITSPPFKMLMDFHTWKFDSKWWHKWYRLSLNSAKWQTLIQFGFHICSSIFSPNFSAITRLLAPSSQPWIHIRITWGVFEKSRCPGLSPRPITTWISGDEARLYRFLSSLHDWDVGPVLSTPF